MTNSNIQELSLQELESLQGGEGGPVRPNYAKIVSGLCDYLWSAGSIELWVSAGCLTVPSDIDP